MPLHHLLKRRLAILLDNIAVARDHALEVPRVDSRNALIERRLVLANCVPQKPPVTGGLTLQIRKVRKDLCENARSRVDARLAELLGCGQVEDEVGLDQRARGLVVEDDLLIGMRVNVFILKLRIELLTVSYSIVDIFRE